MRALGASRIAGAVVIVAALLTGSCGRGDPTSVEGPRGIVLVSIDELRRDRLAPYGGPFDVPGVAGGTVAGRWYADMAAVSPTPRAAATTLLTGATPVEHGVRDDVLDDYESGVLRSVPERLSEAGWRTAAFVDSPILGFGSGLDELFEVFDGPALEVFGPGGYYPIARESGVGLDNLDRWLASVGEGERWFAWIQLAGLYGVAAGTPLGEDPAAAYDTAVPEALAPIERLMTILAARDEPVDVVLVGAYGTRLGADGAPRGSAFWLDEETLGVPLFVGTTGAGGPIDPYPVAGARWLPDVAATVLDRAGLAHDGVAGVPLGRDPGMRERSAWTWATHDRLGWPPLVSRRDGDTWTAARPDASIPVRTWDVSDAARAELREHGVTLGAANDVRAIEAPALRDEFAVRTEIARFGLGNNLQRRTGRQGRWLQRQQPDQLASLHIRLFLATVFEDRASARGLVDELYARFPERPETLHWGAHAELLAGERGRARVLLNTARSVGIADGDVEYDLACIAALEGDVDRAIAQLERAVERGFRLWRWMERDPDLTDVRSDPRYAAFMAKHR